MQTSNAIAQIKERLPIAELIGKYVPLESHGARLVASCPFHDDTKPSFSVYPDSDTYHCYGCGAHGDVIDFWMAYHGVDFCDALVALAEMAHVQLDAERRSEEEVRKAKERRDRRQQIIDLYRFAQVHFRKNLASPSGIACRDYLQSRGISEDLGARFGLGWALDDWHGLTRALQRDAFDMQLAIDGGLVNISRNSGKPYDPFRARLMFPIRDASGTTIAFGGRIIDNVAGQAKYVNTSDSIIYKKGDHLYGLDLAGQSIRRTRRVFVTEGYMDVLTLHQFGFGNAVAGLGTALTDQQVKRILGYSPEIILLYDGDNAGHKAAMGASEKFLAEGAKTRVVLLPEGEDADSILRRPGGPEAFNRLQAQAKPALQFCMETMRDRSPREALQWCKDFVRTIRLPELVSPTISYLARHLGFDEREFRRSLHEDAGSHTRGATPTPIGRPSLSVIEKEVLRCVVRYPERLAEMDAMGAGDLLSSPFARSIWTKVARARPGEAGYDLKDEERAFWDRWRGPEAPMLDAPDQEMQALREAIDERRGGDRCCGAALGKNARYNSKEAPATTSSAPPPAVHVPAAPPAISSIEEAILHYAVRYPDRIGEIAFMGVDFLLSSPFAVSFWSKLARSQPGEAGYDLKDEERAFWDQWRGPEAPDRDAPDQDLQALKGVIDEHWRSRESALRNI